MTSTVLRTRFLGDAVAGRTYDYFVPPFIPDGAFKAGGHAVVRTGGDPDGECKVVVIIEVNPLVPKATKAIVGIADLSHSVRHQQAMRERRRIIAAMERLERQRQEDLRLQELSKNSEEGAKLYSELKALNTSLGLDILGQPPVTEYEEA